MRLEGNGEFFFFYFRCSFGQQEGGAWDGFIVAILEGACKWMLSRYLLLHKQGCHQELESQG